MVKIDVTEEFKRQIKPLVKKYKSLKDDYANLLEELKNNPYSGVDLGGGQYKVRMAIASKGKGKSGGARVITYVVEETPSETHVHLLTIYDKSAMPSVSTSYIQYLVDLLRQ